MTARPDETATWARNELEDLLQVPLYGTEQWHALEPNDPRRQAGLVLAAEAWRQQQTVTGRPVSCG